jgi:hypothetical protein
LSMSKDMRDPTQANVPGVCSDILTVDFVGIRPLMTQKLPAPHKKTMSTDSM